MWTPGSQETFPFSQKGHLTEDLVMSQPVGTASERALIWLRIHPG